MSRARSRWDLEVTSEDIAAAAQNDSMRCIVAQTIARSIPQAHHIDVDLQAIRFTLGEQRLLYLTPYAVQGYIVAFDAGEDILPFRFRIQTPQILKRRKRTAAGKDVQRARNRAQRASGPKKSRAKRELKTTKDAYAAEAQTVTEPGERPPLRAIKSRTRSYGQRQLRINQK